MSDYPLNIRVSGKPFAWRRTKGSGKRRYQDPEQAAWKELFRIGAESVMRKMKIQTFDEPIEVRITATWKHPGKPRKEPRDWAPRPCVPDIDNIAKAVLDAGNGVIWSDDAIVVKLSALKMYVREPWKPCTLVQVRPFTKKDDEL